MAKKKTKVNGIELPFEFNTVDEFYNWANTLAGAAALEDTFETEFGHGTIYFSLTL